MMVLKVFLFLAALALVSLPTCSATVQQEQAEQQCVSRAEFDSWWNATLTILHRVVPKNQTLPQVTIPDQMKNVKHELLNNLDNLEDKLKNVRDKVLDELATLRSTTMDALTDLQHQIKQQQNKTEREMAALKSTIMEGQDKVDTLQDKVVNLQDKLDMFQNTTEASTRINHHEVMELLQSISLDGQANLLDKVDSLQDKVVNLQDKLDTFQNTTEASTRKNHHEVVELLQNTSLDGQANVQDKVDTLQDKVVNLVDKLDTFQNTTEASTRKHYHEVVELLQNTSLYGQANLLDKVDTLQDKVVNLQDKLETFQNTTEASTRKHHHEVVELLQNTSLDGQDKVDTLQDKVINLQDKLYTFQNATEASTRKHHHEVVELLQNNTSCSLDGTEELQKQLENITEGLQDQLQTCIRTDTSIQYLPASCSEIVQLNPHSPSGYYEISTTSGAVYCVITAPDNPASSCQDIARHPLASPGYYWVNSSNGTAVQVHCSMTTPDNPASSCQDIATQHPLASSGYYWVSSSNGIAVQVYCDMERHCCGSTGGWMRAAYLDMTDPTHHCPTGFRLTSHSKRSCERITRPGCTGLTFAVQSVRYSKVCGKVIGYQYGSPDALYQYYYNRALTLDGLYVEGVSITHGHPRRHIWTFAAAVDEQHANAGTCPCTKTGTTYTGVVPPFLGNDYFCDTGSHNYWPPRFHPDNPLWDGRGCGPTSSCCSFNSPPWFCKELPQHTTDDIEVRVCTDQRASDEDITIEAVELYVQ